MVKLRPYGKVTNLLFNYFVGYNEGMIGRKAEMRGSTVKCGKRQLEGGRVCDISFRLPMSNGTMETLEYNARLYYWMMSQECRNTFL